MVDPSFFAASIFPMETSAAASPPREALVLRPASGSGPSESELPDMSRITIVRAWPTPYSSLALGAGAAASPASWSDSEAPSYSSRPISWAVVLLRRR